MRVRLSILVIATLVITASPAVAKPLPLADGPGEGPMFSDLTLCSSPRDLDCVESISLVTVDGVVHGTIATQSKPEPWPQVDPESGEFGLSKGHGVYRGMGHSRWTQHRTRPRFR